PAAAAGENNKGGKILVGTSEAVGDPRAHGGASRLLISGSKKSHCRIMIDRFGKHGANESDFVGNPSDVREHAAQFDAGSAVALKLVGGSDAFKNRLAGGHTSDALTAADAGREFLAAHLGELRLWIEQ